MIKTPNQYFVQRGKSHGEPKVLVAVAILVLLSLVFVGCKGHGVTEGNDGIVYSDGAFVEAPDKLVAYFDSLLRCTPAFIYTRNVDDIEPNPDSLAVLSSIKALDDYQAHRTSEYPLKQVADALGSLVYAQWHNNTHGDEEEEMMAGSEQFFFRYLEQAARLCPHVDYLTSIHTGDDKAGIFTGHEFSEWHQPYYCILLYRFGSGYRTRFLQYYNEYDRIEVISDSAGQSYLLCSSTSMGNSKPILLREVEGEYVEVCLSVE